MQGVLEGAALVLNPRLMVFANAVCVALQDFMGGALPAQCQSAAACPQKLLYSWQTARSAVVAVSWFRSLISVVYCIIGIKRMLHHQPAHALVMLIVWTSIVSPKSIETVSCGHAIERFEQK